jgi:hypothetical protein
LLFEQRFWEPIRRGEVTVTFRRWKRRQAVAGRRYRTPGGIIEAESVDVVTIDDITDADARAGLFPDRAALIAALRGTDDMDLYRIRFHVVDEPDPRAELAASAGLTAADVADIDQRLDRLDRASSVGAWTRPTLRLIEAKPATRAGDLAAEVGRELQPFKLDVRKLKNLGLTISLGVGYELSPRGQAYLDQCDLP